MDWHPRTYLIQTLIFLFLGFTISCNKDNSPSEGDSNLPGEESNLPVGKVEFDISPIDLDGVLFFEPMGLMGVFPQDHGGFFHDQYDVPEPSIRIYALADGHISALGKSGRDFWVEIKYSTTISTKLGHVGRFENFILDQTGPLLEGQPKYINIDVKKGQVIGYVSSFSALDIGLHDQESIKSFCHPELFWFETLYASDIFDYFKEPVKSELLSKAIREQPPRGGKVDYDVCGALVGNWFLQGGGDARDKFENHFAIGYDHIHPQRVAIYDGYACFAENNCHLFRAWIKNNAPLPETIDVAYGIVKYEIIYRRGWTTSTDNITTLQSLEGVDEQIPHGVFIFQMLNSETMQVEYFPDQLADEITEFSGNQRIYVRNP